MQTQHYYAISYTYGANVGDDQGRDIGDVYQFATRAERDAWVDASPTAYTTQCGYRAAYPAAKARKAEILNSVNQ